MHNIHYTYNVLYYITSINNFNSRCQLYHSFLDFHVMRAVAKFSTPPNAKK